MEHKNRVPVLAALAIIFVGLAVCGGISANEPMLGLGIAAAFLCLLLIPAFHLRAARLKKISQKENPLIRFEYASHEIDEIAAVQRQAVFKKSVRLSILFSLCFAILFTPFVLMSMEPNSELPPMLPFAVACVVLPWLSLIIAPKVVENAIRTRPCVSLVGRDYVLIANRYQGVNDRLSLTADRIRFENGRDGNMGCLNVRYSFKAFRYHTQTINLWVQIPVPHDREKETTVFRLK